MPTLFISYSSADKRFVDRLAGSLRGAGVDIWLDRWEIRVGESIVKRINDAIAVNDFIAIVLSPASVESPWVSRELNSSLRRQLAEKSVQILPVLHKTCSIPDIIADIKYADFRKHYQTGLNELLDAIIPDQLRHARSLTLNDRFEKLVTEVERDPWKQGSAVIAPVVRELKRIMGLNPAQIVEGLSQLVQYKYGDITYHTIYQAAPPIFEILAHTYPHLRAQISVKLIEMLRYPLFLPWSEILHSEKSPLFSALIEACGPEAIPALERELAERGTDDSFYTAELVLILRKFGPLAKSCVPHLIRIYTGFGDESSPSVRESIAKTLGDIADDTETVLFLKHAADFEKKLMDEKPDQKQWVEEFSIHVDYEIRKAIEAIEARLLFSSARGTAVSARLKPAKSRRTKR